ncbi:ATP-binding protein, partial [Vreelandella hamiltonii]|uniref:ATP-binding protein n=1 Tax=Vreelandella hamiltonii TaxID=502829 RepID=UPI001E286818
SWRIRPMLVVIWRDQSTGYATLSTALHTQELSLTLCKAITEHMGGSIGFTSHQGQGSTFYISFPWGEEQGRALH